MKVPKPPIALYGTVLESPFLRMVPSLENKTPEDNGNNGPRPKRDHVVKTPKAAVAQEYPKPRISERDFKSGDGHVYSGLFSVMDTHVFHGTGSISPEGTNEFNE